MWDICMMSFITLVLNHNISLNQRSVTDRAYPTEPAVGIADNQQLAMNIFIYFDKNNMISRRQTKRHSSVELSLPPVHKYKLINNQSVVIR